MLRDNPHAFAPQNLVPENRKILAIAENGHGHISIILPNMKLQTKAVSMHGECVMNPMSRLTFFWHDLQAGYDFGFVPRQHDISSENVKEHATLSAGASVDNGVEVKTTEDHVNRAADRGCSVSACSASSICWRSSGKVYRSQSDVAICKS
jgi:hypothetical protein